MKYVLGIAAIAAVVLTSPVEAKKKPQLTSLEIQAMQSREFETDKDTAFAAVMTVLQDEGYRIGSADKETGLITGAASTESKTTWVPFIGFGRGKKTPVVSAFIEQRTRTMTRVRFNFVMTKNSSNQFGSNADEEPILDAQVYQDAFVKLDKEIFVRHSMKEGSDATSPKSESTTSLETKSPTVSGQLEQTGQGQVSLKTQPD